MNIKQALKMSWKSILGKKGRSALTMLGIIIGIASVMTIVSVMSGMMRKTMEQFSAMGSNRIDIQIYSYWMGDNSEQSKPKDYFPDIYNYCNGMKDYILGITPTAYLSATVVYGTKSTANMQYSYDDQGNPVGDYPPTLYLGSDQYSICNNLTVAKGRDLTVLDIDRYKQVCVIGAQAAKTFFGVIDPLGKTLRVNGYNFEVVGVYASRLSEESQTSGRSIDNFIVFPYTAKRTLGDTSSSSEYMIKAASAEASTEIISRLNGYLKGLVDTNSGGYYVEPADQWQQYQNDQLSMIGGVLAGIAAISLLVGGIGIMNIMLVTVTERTREIGIRRAIGAERSSIVTQFLIEAAMICGIGGIIGIGLGTVGSLALGQLMFQMTIYPSVWITFCAFSLSVLLGVLFGIYPAAKASKLQPVEALRAE